MAGEMWQSCPTCGGRGRVTFPPYAPLSSTAAETGPWTCPTCSGHRIINQFSGHPPMSPVSSESAPRDAQPARLSGEVL